MKTYKTITPSDTALETFNFAIVMFVEEAINQLFPDADAQNIVEIVVRKEDDGTIGIFPLSEADVLNEREPVFRNGIWKPHSKATFLSRTVYVKPFANLPTEDWVMLVKRK